MAKPLPTRRTAESERRHIQFLDAYAEAVEALFHQAGDEAVRIALSVPFDPEKPFTFGRFPVLTERVQNLLSNLAGSLRVTIHSGIGGAWERANTKNDAVVDELVQRVGITDQSAYRNRNAEALKAFQNRKVGGIALSQRVWKFTDQFKTELELALDVGLSEGKSATELSRTVRGLLQDPDRLFRRVRDKRGQLHLSKASAAYKPGQGTYRSSYKNALRLTRSEINTAYRTADHLRVQQLPFVVGIEVRRSGRQSDCPVCEKLKGEYPKTFVFRGWHPACRCFTVNVLATPQEMRDYNRQLLNGDEVSQIPSANTVAVPHAGWAEWLNENRERLAKSPTKPLFVEQNPGFVEAVKSQPAKPSVVDILSQNDDFNASMVTIRKRTGLPKKLSETELAAINTYTFVDYYNLNRHLRGVRVEDVDYLTALGETISDGLRKLPAVKKVVYRKVQLPDIGDFKQALARDKPLTFASFTSTSLDPNITFDGNVKLIIQSKRGRSIAPMSNYPNEKEILFDKGSRFRVEKITPDRSGYIIRLTEI